MSVREKECVREAVSVCERERRGRARSRSTTCAVEAGYGHARSPRRVCSHLCATPSTFDGGRYTVNFCQLLPNLQLLPSSLFLFPREPRRAPLSQKYALPQLQGYLTYKKPPPRRTLQWDYAQAPLAVQGGGGRFIMSEVPLHLINTALPCVDLPGDRKVRLGTDRPASGQMGPPRDRQARLGN